MKRYLIEDLLPLEELSKEAKREKAIRHGHISTLHVWWARRPLVVARAAALGALLPSPESDEERERLKRFLVNLCNWDAHPSLVEEARKLIAKHYPDGPPKVLDSFAGGGSIPLEALRLGCEAFAVEYNPVAYLILKATLEYPQRYGPKLAEDVAKWGEWILEKARAELAEFYPKEADGATPIAYIWSRTVRCPNPACGAEIPLFRQFWLARKPNKRIALKPVVDHSKKRVEFEVVTVGANEDWPSHGTVRRATAHCLVCGGTAQGDYLRSESKASRMGHRLVAVVKTQGRGRGRTYEIANSAHIEAFEKAARRLEELKANHKGNLSLLPNERMPVGYSQAFPVTTWGYDQWGQLFNPRQALALVTFARLVREAHDEIKKECCDAEYAKAVTTYLGFALDKLTERNNVLGRWENTHEKIHSALSGHHIHMTWNYIETNPFSELTSGWSTGLNYIADCIQAQVGFKPHSVVALGSAACLNVLRDGTLHAVVIDPPYYDNVPYADLSDFFYVWLKRSVGHLYPEAFSTQLVPKDEEIVHNPARWATAAKTKRHSEAGGPDACACADCISRKHYEQLLTQSFKEIHRVLKDDALAVIMFTHKSTAAWESLIQSLLNAGLYPTASWPVHTEFTGSTHTYGKGSIVSTILLACRKRHVGQTQGSAPTGWYHELKPKLEARVRERLQAFWEAGISGADFFVSAIGPALEIFCQYEKVLHPSGQTITVSELLDEVRKLVADFALQMILKGEGVGQVDAPTRFYVLFRWAYDADEVPYDDARKLAQALGVELDALAHVGLVKKQKDKVQMLAALERDPKALEKQDDREALLINELHKALVLWEKGDLENLQKFLAEEGLLNAERFWRAAQALVSVLPDGDEERKLLEQLMPAREGLLRKESQRAAPREQKGLFEAKEDR